MASGRSSGRTAGRRSLDGCRRRSRAMYRSRSPTEQRPGAVMEPGFAQLVVDVRQRARHAGEPRDVERPGLAESAHASDFVRGDRAVLDEQGNGLPAPDHEQPARRIGDPGSLQRRDHGREQLEPVARRHLHVTRNGEITAGIQSRQVELECLDRVNVVFVEAAEAAGGDRRRAIAVSGRSAARPRPASRAPRRRRARPRARRCRPPV